MEKIYEILRIKQEIIEVNETDNLQVVSSPQDVVKVIEKRIADEDREVFLVLCLNTKNKVVAIHRAHVGSINASIVHPREVFKSAILNNAASIIVAHNHPSGQSVPSPEDFEVTKRLVKAGEIIGIEVLDHIVIGRNEYTSLKSQGRM